MPKSTIRKKTYQAIYRLLNRVSPIQGDCGVLCGCACCDFERLQGKAKDAQFGMYLLPGEDKVFTRKEDWLSWSADTVEKYDFPASWTGQVYFVVCKTPPHCVRELRPIQCRTFPLAPHIDKEGAFHLVWNTEPLPYQCPLVAARAPLQDRFIRATYTVWKRLITDPMIYDFVVLDSQYRGQDVDIVM